MIRPDSSDAKLGATGCIVLPASLFVGLMIASAGTAVYPRVAWPGAALLCPGGEIVYQSHGQSYRPGEYTVTRQIYCRSGAGKGAAQEEITFRAIGLAFLIYSAFAFLILRFLVAPWLRRRGERALSAVGLRPPIEPGAAPAVDLGSILGQVSEAVRRGQARVVVHDAQVVDLSGEEPAERLARLKALRDQGLITASDYEAKKAEILAGM